MKQLPGNSAAWKWYSICTVLLIFMVSAVKEEKPEERDPLSDLQDISDSERKTSSAESSSGD